MQSRKGSLLPNPETLALILCACDCDIGLQALLLLSPKLFFCQRSLASHDLTTIKSSGGPNSNSTVLRVFLRSVQLGYVRHVLNKQRNVVIAVVEGVAAAIESTDEFAAARFTALSKPDWDAEVISPLFALRLELNVCLVKRFRLLHYQIPNWVSRFVALRQVLVLFSATPRRIIRILGNQVVNKPQ